MALAIDFAIGILITLVVVILAWNLLNFMVRWIGHYPLLAFPVVLILLIVFGKAGHDYGLPNLFRPTVMQSVSSFRDVVLSDEVRLQFFSALSVMWFFALVAFVVHLLDRLRYRESRSLERKLEKLNRSLRPIVPWRWFRSPSRASHPDDPYFLAIQSVLVPCEALAALSSIPAFMDLATDSRATFFDSLRSPVGISWGWLAGVQLGLLTIFIASRATRRLIKPETFRKLLDFRFIREDPKFKWGNCLRMLVFMGPLLGIYVAIVLAFQRNPPFNLPVSSLLCVLFGLWVVMNAIFKVLNRTLRVLLFSVLLVVAFLSNGTDLKHSPDEFKLQLPNLSASREPRSDEKTNVEYNYYDKPEGLDSRSYLDRCYMDPVPVVDASKETPIVITSARAHGLRDFDHVRIGGVWGNTNANGLFAIQTIEGSTNKFKLLNSRGNGDYDHGGEWFEELGHGLVQRATHEADGTIVITSPAHGLRDGDQIEMSDRRGSVGFQGRCKVAIRHEDARSADQFVLAGQKGVPGHRPTWGGRWRRVVSVLHEGRKHRPTQGGISSVSIPQPRLVGATPPIVVESQGHGVLDGDHVLIEDVVVNPAANGVWTVTVEEGNDGCFTLDYPIGTADAAVREAPNPDRPAAGKWRVVTDRGRVVGASNVKDQEIVISSPLHQLTAGQHVEITGVRGNTRANGVFTVGIVIDPDHFSLFHAKPFKYDARYNYLSGGEWRLTPEKGRVRKVNVAEGGKVRIHSQSHHLDRDTRVMISGLDDPDLHDANGIFAVEKIDEHVFELVGAKAAGPKKEYRYEDLGKLDEGQPTWHVTLESGGITKVTKRPGGPIVVHSPGHGLGPGDHVMIKGRRWATGAAIYAVDVNPEAEADTFLLAGTESISLEGGSEGGPPSADEGPGGQWKMMAGRGGIVSVDLDPEGQIRVNSPRHNLREGERVQINGLSWGRERSRELGLFTVAPRPGVDSFSLRGTKHHFQVPDQTQRPSPGEDGPGDGSKIGAKSSRSGIIGEWRFVYRPRDNEPVLITDSWPATDGLRIESIGHGLKVGDCVRIENTWSAPKARGPEAARPVLSTQANGLFQVKSAPDLDHFEIKFARVPDDRTIANDLEYFKGDWRPARDQGFIEEYESKEARGWVKSTRHGLAKGARLLVEGTDRVSLVDVPDKDSDHFSLDKGGDIKANGRWCLAGLLDDAELLANWESCRNRDGQIGNGEKKVTTTKPKLAIVAVSGGGIRSSIWTAMVLRQLESRIPEMPYHIRMITGASGGMLGAGSYVSSLKSPERDEKSRHSPSLDEIATHLRGDFLRPVANQLVFNDLPLMFYPATQLNDRGLMLEKAWTKPSLTADTGSVLDRRFRDLAVGEWEGWRPSLVFTPMLVEDGRRILISNVNLDYVPRNIGHVLLPAETRALSRNSRLSRDDLKEGFDIFSLSAVEFFRLFPEAWDFKVSTAIRMSAAFPLITPAVSLPTIPPRRVVDAGYYDNYGVNLASLWLFQNHEWLMDHTSGVVLIQIRDFQAERARRELGSAPETPGPEGLVKRFFRASQLTTWLLDRLNIADRNAGRGSQWLTSPIEGASAARYSINSFRNDEQIEALSNLIHFLKPDRPVLPGFYTTVVFECPKEASLSWAVTAQEDADIRDGFSPDKIEPSFSEGAKKNADRLNQLQNWWKN